MVCQWCQEELFGPRTIALVEGAYQGWDMDSELYKNPGDDVCFTVNTLVYFSGGDMDLAPVRTFHRNLNSFQNSARQGCIFCSQLLAAFLPHSEKQNAPTSGDADLTMRVRIVTPWKYCSISIHKGCLEDQPDLPSGASLSFRLYMKRERVNTVPLSKHVLSADDSQPSQLQPTPEQGKPNTINFQHTRVPDWDQNIRGLCTMLKSCLTSHSDCNQSTATALPSRLLHLSGTVISPAVRLVSTTHMETGSVRYACLSYCWGGPQTKATTAERVARYSEGIDISSVPQTVYDAIKVTLGLGLEYLWVDSFCIVQDSAEEKTLELNKMSSIYTGALFTICVMSARTAMDGFLEIYNKPPGDVPTWNVEVTHPTHGQSAVVEMRSDNGEVDYWKEPLLQRAWCYQEALLSRRSIMFFSDGQLPALRCATRTVRSDGGAVNTFPKSLMHLDDKALCERDMAGTLGWNASNQWSMLVAEYTRRALAFATDKPLALLGVASEVARKAPLGRYWAGLWSRTVHLDLLWEPNRVSPRGPEQVYVGPSWSWLSRNHGVHYPHKYHMCLLSHDTAQITCQVVPVNPISPMGQIKSAVLTVCCWANQVGSVDEWPADVVFDDDPAPQLAGKIWLLNIAEHEAYNNPHPLGLVVAEVDHPEVDNRKLYRRVGLFSDSRKAFDDGIRRTFDIV